MKIPLQLDEASLSCPITGQTIQDPVIDHEGNSYEKTAILEWLLRNPTSPITRNPLAINQLAPNRALKALLEENQMATDDESVDKLSCPPDFDVSAKIVTSSDLMDDHALIQLSVADDESTSHKPASVICVIDISGSMGSAAIMHGDSEGSGGLSLLDIVKHASRTVIETLSPQDRLSIISYSTTAQLVLPLTHMTPENKTKAWTAVDRLRPDGGTNLWAGLVEAMNLVKLDNQHCSIILLTDGQPNIQPPRGELDTLKRFKAKNPTIQASISTFGFGYNLKSELLRDIAQEGKGHFCFIPDSSFVGTVFVNATANILSTAIPASTLVVESDGELKDLSGHNFKQESSNTLTFELPPLIYGQTLDILVQAQGATTGGHKLPPLTKLRLSNKTVVFPEKPGGGIMSRMRATLKDSAGRELCSVKWDCDCAVNNEGALDVAKTRAKVQTLIAASELKLSVSNSSMLYDSIQEDVLGLVLDHTKNPSIEAMNADLRGQIREAYSRQEWHRKWGKHYLPSLARAYVLQQCTNFKDPGVQIYTTKKFALIRDKSEEMFCKLPPPSPSRPLTRSHVPVRSMSRYYNSSTPCFGRGMVSLVDGRKIDIAELRKGDMVESVKGPVRVKCIVKTVCPNGFGDLVELDGGVIVTPWHPVRKIGTSKWCFPADLGKPAEAIRCNAVYSFVLENREACLKIGPFEGIAMGHNVADDPVAKHVYFGTEKVTDDLAELPGWSSGLVTLGPESIQRDPQSNLIVKLRSSVAVIQ